MTDREKEIEKMANAIEEGCKEKKKKHRCNVVGCDECMAEFLVGLGYRKADELLDEIAVLTGKVEALQKDNENLRRTLEESREGEKPKMRENELHEPKIKTEIKAAEGYSTLYYVSACCPVCDFFLGKSLGLSKEQVIDEVKQGSIYNYCPQCGALLKEVKDETPKD